MAAIPVPAASPGSGGDVSIRMPAAAAAAAAAAGGEVPPPGDVQRGAAANANANPEKHLSRFVRCVAFGEWAGNAFGALAFVWATGVLLGGFCSSLNRQDFCFATVMIFIEAFRIFSRNYKLDSQSLFGTARALWINSSFIRMLGRPQEGNQVVLIMVLWLNLLRETAYFTVIVHFILAMALLVPWSRRPRRPQQWQMWAVAIAYLLFAAYSITHPRDYHYSPSQTMPFLPVLIEAGAVLLVALLLNLRPSRGFANLITTPPCGGTRLISLAKVISALWLSAEHMLLMCPLINRSIKITLFVYSSTFSASFAILVLSLGSLQSHGDTSVLGRWADAILHIVCLWHFLLSLPMAVSIDLFVAGLYPLPAGGLSFLLLLVLPLIGNLQIPAAVAQTVLSSLRLSNLLRDPRIDYNPLPAGTSPNLVAAIAVFYLLALCQGSLYIVASFLALFSTFPRRWLMRRSKFGGKLLGAKAIDLYYQRAYATMMEMGVFGAGSTMSFADFAIEFLSSSSSSRDLRVAGLYVLHNILLERRTDDCSTQDLILRVTSGAGIQVSSTLIGMLAWDADVEQDGYAIRLLAARVTAELASSLRISSIPGMLKLVSSLLKLAENNTDAVVLVPTNQQQRPEPQQTPLAIANGIGVSVQLASNGGWWRSWVVCRFWQRMKQEYWSIPEEPATLFTHQHSSLPVLGMVILEKLARDIDNCAEILKDDTSNLISKTIGLIGLATSDNEQNDELVCSSLGFLRRLASTGERIGAALRHELWNHPFLLTCLARVLEEDRSSSSSPHQVWEPAMDIIAKLALDSAAGLEIGRNQVITARLLHAFLGRQRSTNIYYDQSLRKVSGEALANLALWGTANCFAILDEPGYQVIIDLTKMLSDDDHRYVAASLLLNICEHCSVNLLLSHPHASAHLSSALTTVMKHMIAAEGKQLESLISLASEIGDVTREAFVRELESQTKSGAELVQKVVCTLNSKKIPSPEYPRMRRVIVKIMISMLESCRRTVEKLMEEGMMERLMESLTKIERAPSRIEEYKVFYGNIGVVPEDAEPMSTLVARAKTLLVRCTTQSAGAPTIDTLSLVYQ